MSITVGAGWEIEPGWVLGSVPIPPPPPGPQQEYTTPGSYYWTAPTGVTSVCIVAVGGSGAVRIIWGSGRAFPSTDTGNL